MKKLFLSALVTLVLLTACATRSFSVKDAWARPGNSGGNMEMKPQESVDIPAGGNVQFQPGGLHVMLVGLKNDLKVGDTLKVTLKFETAGEITVDATVKEP